MTTIPAITRDALDNQIEVLLNHLFLIGKLATTTLERLEPDGKSAPMLANLLALTEESAEAVAQSIQRNDGRNVQIRMAEKHADDQQKRWPWVQCPDADEPRAVHQCIYCPHGLHVSKQTAVVVCAFRPDDDDNLDPDDCF